MSEQSDSHVPVVLIVEDEEHIAEALAFLVEDAGYVARLATHGKAALEVITAGAPDLVISDLMMPQMDGAQLLQALRAQGRSTLPVVLMSAAGREHVANLGADATLGKPFEVAEVEALLHRFLS
jgi:DNA-binding response OmpR family regulator